MSHRQLLELLGWQAFAAPIGRMGLKLELGRLEPAAKRFGINSEPTTTVGYSQQGHRVTPFVGSTRQEQQQARQERLPTEMQGVFPGGFQAHETSKQPPGLRRLSADIP
jgi:hypothetical protein